VTLIRTSPCLTCWPVSSCLNLVPEMRAQKKKKEKKGTVMIGQKRKKKGPTHPPKLGAG